MTRPDDLTPPTPEPIPDERKRELREQILAAATGSSDPKARRWLAPGLAAAAVAAIVGGAALVVSHGGDSGTTGGEHPLVPAGRGGSSVQVGPSSTRSRTPTPPPPPAPPLTGAETTSITAGTATSARVPPPPLVATTCDEEVAGLPERELDGAAWTAAMDYDLGTTWLYETKTAWVVCDDFAASDGGAPTLFAVHHTSAAYEPDPSTLAISENFQFRAGVFASQYVAAGRDFDGVQAISYHFPDGHTQAAVVGENGLWSMTYLPTDGPLNDPDTDQTTFDPIEVMVTFSGGETRSFTLQWGLDTCAQTNHGC